MAYTVSANMISSLSLMPDTTQEEILQNIAVILSTPKYSVPMHRNFGMAYEFLDKPVQVAKTLLVSEVVDAIEAFETRAKVLGVTFDESALAKSGQLIPQVEVEIIE